jgi:hypothetical protein
MVYSCCGCLFVHPNAKCFEILEYHFLSKHLLEEEKLLKIVYLVCLLVHIQLFTFILVLEPEINLLSSCEIWMTYWVHNLFISIELFNCHLHNSNSRFKMLYLVHHVINESHPTLADISHCDCSFMMSEKSGKISHLERA